jgi:hypothetical protein
LLFVDAEESPVALLLDVEDDELSSVDRSFNSCWRADLTVSDGVLVDAAESSDADAALVPLDAVLAPVDV